MTTVAQARTAIRDRLLTGSTRLIDVLNGAINDTATSLTITLDTVGTGQGRVIEIDDEQMFITNKSSLVLTVIRGWGGTTAASHSDAAIIEVDPRFTASMIATVLTEELRSWPVRFGRIDTVEVAIPSERWKAELVPTNATAVVHRILTSNVLDSTSSSTGQRSRLDVRLIRDADEDEFASGYAIQVPFEWWEARTVQLDLLTDYDLSAIGTSTTDLQTDVGLRDEMIDILYYGTMWRLMSTLEIGRTSAGSRTAQDSEQVPPTHMLQTSQALKDIRDARMRDETLRMYDRFPFLMSTEG